MNLTVLKLEVGEGIAWITINRPEALNALNTVFFREMEGVLNQLSGDKSVRVAVITGEGKAFVAGADIAEMAHMSPEEGSRFSQTGQAVFSHIEQMAIPVIAAINGFALGGGMELAMSCDFRIASSKARFGQPEVNLGLIPGYAGTQRLPRLVGLGHALYLLTTAEMIDAQTAFSIGLVQKVVEPEQLKEETLKIVQTIMAKGPQAVSLVKQVTRGGMLTDFESGCNLESDRFGSLFGPGSQGEEGMKAFLEKRKPEWK
ncbi:MAG: enoyl-CoA hydratase/isomerase family protein [Bacteroidales bacterium]|nr:enoyl-CoA hydratase/isomerase family protein [Bacteroidales bacterium]